MRLSRASRLNAALFLSACLPLGAQAATKLTSASDACTPSESWNFGEDFERDWKKSFEATLLPKSVGIQSFGEAWAMRTEVRDAEQKVFAEYWTSRALYSMDMVGLAQSGFASVVARKTAPQLAGIRLAAVECLVRIQERFPTMELSSGVVAAFAELPKGDVLEQAASIEIRRRIGLGRPKAEVEQLFIYLQPGSARDLLSRMMAAAHVANHDQTILKGRAFLALGAWPKGLERYVDIARLLLGRALYSVGQYTLASEEFRKISKSSNVLAHSLSDLSWAQLRSEGYMEAIGTAINLQSGSLRRTFTPESVMVMAMAFNEICHFPESLKAVEHYRTTYASSYKWLQDWKEQGAGKLYPQATAFLRKEGKIPEKVASEWIRSPHFIARQDEIQLSFQYKAKQEKVAKNAADLQRKMARDLLEFIKELKPRYDHAKTRLPADAALPNLLQQDLQRLKMKITEYRRLKRAAGPWRALASHQEKKAAGDRTRLVNEIEKEVSALNLRMLMQLDEIAENLHFLEVEIFQGASQDIIWQNAHPDYKELVVTFKKESRSNWADNWNWGSVQGGLGGTHEIWEDELGSFKAEVFDNCTSKDKYLAVKRHVVTQK